MHGGRHELDLLALDPGPPAELVAVEVRYRSRRDFGVVEETVDGRKRGRMRAALGRLLEAGRLRDGTPLPELPVRLDVVVVEPGATGTLGDGAGTPGVGVGVGEPRIRHHRGVG